MDFELITGCPDVDPVASKAYNAPTLMREDGPGSRQNEIQPKPDALNSPLSLASGCGYIMYINQRRYRLLLTSSEVQPWF